MKVWRVSFCHRDIGHCLEWVGSNREASARAAHYRRLAKQANDDDGIDEPIGINPVDVPTDKSGLLRWLNTNLSTDNG